MYKCVGGTDVEFLSFTWGPDKTKPDPLTELNLLHRKTLNSAQSDGHDETMQDKYS